MTWKMQGRRRGKREYRNASDYPQDCENALWIDEIPGRSQVDGARTGRKNLCKLWILFKKGVSFDASRRQPVNCLVLSDNTTFFSHG